MRQTGAPIRRRALAVALGAVLTLSVVQAPPAAATNKREEALRTHINRERASRGLRKLRLHQDLSRVARRHSRRMADRGTWYHSSTTQLRRYMRVGNCVSRIGENVGYFDVDVGVAGIHQAFMDSSGHRKTLLRSYWKKMGIGVVRSGGRFYTTELFCV
jgi:uncharacterized protein YkwD